MYLIVDLDIINVVIGKVNWRSMHTKVHRQQTCNNTCIYGTAMGRQQLSGLIVIATDDMTWVE